MTRPRKKTAHHEFRWAFREARVPELRSRLEWARQEITVPEGPREGELFDPDFAPWNRLYLTELDSGRWQRHIAVGPAQSGKTFVCFVIPMAYHLFEVGEKVIGGIPTEEMARDKWDDDIRPVISASRSYERYLPTAGRGSEGGFSSAIRFKNNRTLKFMTGGGKNSKRAGYTSRVVIITETDQFALATMGAVETDKIRQLEARTQAYGSRAVIYMECTVTTKKGRIWQEYLNGSYSQILMRCQHCGEWVRPERKQLVGWQSARDEFEAIENGHFICPHCEHRISEEDRRKMLDSSTLVHKGQSINADGEIQGDMPRTNTLGFRWSAFDNPFVTASSLAAEEWRAQQAGTDEAEKRMAQLFWAVPPDADDETSNTIDLTFSAITTRQRVDLARGQLPPGTVTITVGLDVGLRLCHWVAIAWLPNAIGHVIDYQSVGVPEGDRMSPDTAIILTIREIVDELSKGWENAGGELISPDIIFVDAGYKTDVVYEAVRGKHAGRPGIFPYMGFGGRQSDYMAVQQRSKNLNEVKMIGDHFQVSMITHARVLLVEGDADFWKLRVHEAFSGAIEQGGSLTLYHRPAFEHNQYARHILAEGPQEERRPGGIIKIKMIEKSRNNHLLDATYMALAAGSMTGIIWPGKAPTKRPMPPTDDKTSMITTPDGRPYSILARSE